MRRIHQYPRIFPALSPIIGYLIMISLIMFIAPQCKQAYISPYVSPATGYLVIDGYISGNTLTNFQLSRTVPLSTAAISPPELDAEVQVEGNDNSIYPLSSQGSGLYTSAQILPLNTSVKYRLRIQTQSGEEYLSDFVPYKITPAIDSVTWIQNSSGVNIYVNTHDDAGLTRYYQWQYGEVWEYHSAEISSYIYDPTLDTVLYRNPQQGIFRCWQGDSSSNILIQTSDKLAKDLINAQLLQQIPTGSQTLSVLYSILVKQYALTDSGFNYLSLMQKNNQSLGTIFGPQPTELTGGDIHCLSHPNETVIGYVSAGTIQQQRIFISALQLSHWNYFYSCPLPDTLIAANPSNFHADYANGNYIPLYPNLLSTAYNSNLSFCVDCTMQGGTNNKPAFWPY